ncbi:MAG: DUF4040 domain-containing protein [Nitriliruptorales bacterium]|nr:DUF4040 domain-containing protein [Nitriliruptorales bacterium]
MLLLGLLVLHAVLAVVAVPLGRRLGRGVFALCALAPGAMVLVGALKAPQILGGSPVTETVTWAPALGLAVDLRLDAFSLIMVGLVSGIGVLVFAYSAWYFSPRPDLARFAGTLLGFSGAMLGLVLSDNLLVLYVFWELTSITSYLLIGFDDRKGSARASALQALLITSGGGLVMLAGFVLLGLEADTFSLSGLLADPPGGTLAAAGAFLVLGGAFTKSAQVPFHTWLPGAMVAPTPVSVYLHSATMVKAGVYLIARLAPVFAVLAGWRPLLLAVGVATMLVGGYRALRQCDLKLLLAFGTVSQLGFMVTLFGVGTPAAVHAGVVLLVAHAAFKGTLFLLVGVIDHQAHSRDLRHLSGLGRRMPVTAALATAAAVSMAGLPPLFGFIAKEEAFAAFLEGELGMLGAAGLVGVAAGSVLTVAYTARFLWGAFATKRGIARRDLVGPAVPRPVPAFVAPAAVLAIFGLVTGIVPWIIDGLLAAGARALGVAAEAGDLALWHGPTPELGLSVIAVAVGLGLFAARGRVERLQARVPDLPSANGAYRNAIAGLNRVADRVTGVLQNGSLPTYLSVILGTTILLPLPALLSLGAVPAPDTLAESPVQIAVAIGITALALGVVRARRRFPAVLLLGGVGYGVAVLFVLQGAPDLALTQLLIETLLLVVFVLVLRHLPERFTEAHWPLGEALRRVLAGAVGVFVTAFILIAGAAREAPSVAAFYLQRALPEAEGRNVVNVILVDFRGIDTFGEITVLVIAALGVAGLVRVCRQERQEPVGVEPEPAVQEGSGPEPSGQVRPAVGPGGPDGSDGPDGLGGEAGRRRPAVAGDPPPGLKWGEH